MPPPDLRDVRAVEWKLPLRARLRTDRGTRTVRLWGREPRSALAAVRRLRADVPPDRHEHWPAASEWALRLARCECPGRPLRDFERAGDELLGRWVFVFAAFAGEACGLAIRLLTGDPTALLVGPLFGVAFAAARWYGRRRMPVRVFLTPPGESRMTRRLAATYAALVPLTLAWVPLALGVGWPVWTVFLPAVPVAGSAVWLTLGLARESARFREARAADFAAEWAALHADPQTEPSWQAALWEENGGTRSDPDAGGRPGR